MKQVLTILLFLFIFCFGVTAQSTIVPIVEMKFGGMLGGVQNGKWLPPARVGPNMKSETEFVLIGPNGVEEGGVSLGKKQAPEDVCEGFFRFDFELKMGRGIAIGSNANWKFTPRLPENIDLKNRTYITVVSNFLKKKGIAKPIVKITQAYRVDLEGDGTNEVLISATYYKKGLSSSAAAGDYSFVVLRKSAGKTVTNHLLVGDFVKKKVDFGAPSEHEISGIADLNGDGKMEIVLNGSYYEGDFASAFEMKNGKPVKIKEFEIGCGV